MQQVSPNCQRHLYGLAPQPAGQNLHRLFRRQTAGWPAQGWAEVGHTAQLQQLGSGSRSRGQHALSGVWTLGLLSQPRELRHQQRDKTAGAHLHPLVYFGRAPPLHHRARPQSHLLRPSRQTDQQTRLQ